jgi:asparagine synthetase B (glutamine-hydrolysing)
MGVSDIQVTNGPLEGVWNPLSGLRSGLLFGGPRIHSLSDYHAPLENGSSSFGIEISGSASSLRLSQGLPGMHSLYYKQLGGGSIAFSTYKWRLHKQYGNQGVKLLEGGDSLVAQSNRFLVTPRTQWAMPPIQHGLTLEGAKKGLMEALILSVVDMARAIAGPLVVLSGGGTDSTLVLLAMKEAGLKPISVSSGVSPDNFDPRYAEIYAKKLGVEYHYVSIPKTDGGRMRELLASTIAAIESQEYTNLLMGICTLQVQRWARGLGAGTLIQGYYADSLWGNSQLTVGRYRREAKGNETAEGWAAHRATDLFLMPNTLQIDKISRSDGGSWRTPYLHPRMIDYMLSLPLDITPVRYDKLLPKAILNDHIPDGAWNTKGKVGFYQGAGILSLYDNPGVLSKESISGAYLALNPKNHPKLTAKRVP